MSQKAVMIFFLFSWLQVDTLMAQDDCYVPNSVVPPGWCKYPEGVPNPTDPDRERGTEAGNYEIHIDDRTLAFSSPPNSEDRWPTYVPELSTRSREALDWLRVRGEYEVVVIGVGWSFYPLGVPLFGSSAQFSFAAKVYVKTSPANRANPRPSHDYRGDFSKPEELFENLRRSTNFYVDKSMYDRRTHLLTYYSPVEEVVINGRRWYRYFWNNSAGPDDLREVYVTGLAPDRYLEIFVRQYPVPYPKSGYPTYPAEDQMPGWMKKTHKYKEQVINSIRITKQAGSNEPDLYEIESAPPASETPLIIQ